MKKLTIFILSFLVAGQVLVAQTLDEARKFLLYGRLESAQQALGKIVAGDAKNAEAIYWLGQAQLQAGKVAEAKTTYQNALNNGVNDPLIWVGMGHVETLQGNKDAARQRFESAITNSMKKVKRQNVEDPNILVAIGRANADSSSKIGDPQYAVEKLKRAIEIDQNNAEAYINLGINYLKLGSERGGDAYEAFTNAIKADAGNARARFRLGRIFVTQDNPERFLGYFNDAITIDPSYAPAYLELYGYYANRDVNKAKEYLEKYLANADKDCTTDYFYADYLFRAGKYQESINAADAMANGTCSTYNRLKVLYAYNYDRLGQLEKSRQNIESFLNNAPAAQIQPDDYLFGASVLKKAQGGEQAAISYLKKALENDTTRKNRVMYMDTIASLYRKLNMFPERLEWLVKSYQTNPNPSNLDIYNVADAAINARNYQLGDSMSKLFIVKYPTQEYGYSLLVRNAKAADTLSNKAFDEVEEYIKFLMQDQAKNTDKIKREYYYMATVASDRMKDYPKALEIVNRILVIDPNDAFATQAKAPLEKAVAGPKSKSKTAPKK